MVDIPTLTRLAAQLGVNLGSTVNPQPVVSPPAPAQVAAGRAPASVTPAVTQRPTQTSNPLVTPQVPAPTQPNVASNAVLGMPQSIIPGAGDSIDNTVIGNAEVNGQPAPTSVGQAFQGVQAPPQTPGQRVGTPGPPPQGGNFQNPLLALLLSLTSRGGAAQAPTLPSLATALR